MRGPLKAPDRRSASFMTRPAGCRKTVALQGTRLQASLPVSDRAMGWCVSAQCHPSCLLRHDTRQLLPLRAHVIRRVSTSSRMPDQERERLLSEAWKRGRSEQEHPDPACRPVALAAPKGLTTPRGPDDAQEGLPEMLQTQREQRGKYLFPTQAPLRIYPRPRHNFSSGAPPWGGSAVW
jgi:hypothetical protein